MLPFVSDNSLLSEVKDIILKARETAIRSVNWERTLMYWLLVNEFLKRNSKEKNEPTTVLTLLNISLSSCNPSSEADLDIASWKDVASFIDYFQLRLHCGRN